MRDKHPNAIVVAHPECDPEVWRLADFVGSTSQIYKFVSGHEKKEFIILSEQGLVARMQRDMVHKTIVTTFPLPLCPNMKYHKLESVIAALRENKHLINIDAEIFDKARMTITKMFEVTESTTNHSNFWEGPKKRLINS